MIEKSILLFADWYCGQYGFAVPELDTLFGSRFVTKPRYQSLRMSAMVKLLIAGMCCQCPKVDLKEDEDGLTFWRSP